MKRHEKEMTTFMEKCSGCHSLQRILAKKRSKEEWDRVLKIMAGKPHANVSEEDLKKVQKWIDFMRSTIPRDLRHVPQVDKAGVRSKEEKWIF